VEKQAAGAGIGEFGDVTAWEIFRVFISSAVE
jgi:hypothetical protein